MMMKLLPLFYLCVLPWSSCCQTLPTFTGDWVWPEQKGLPIPFEIIQVEAFMDDYYVAALSAAHHATSLYKVRKFELNKEQFFVIQWLDGRNTGTYQYWKLLSLSEDSAQVGILVTKPIDLGQEDRLNAEGVVVMIDTNAFTQPLYKEKSALKYQKEDSTWRFSSNFRPTVSLSKNPALLEYLVQKYGEKMGQGLLPITLYRWPYFTWNKVNTLQWEDITSITRLNSREVTTIFETAPIDNLLAFQYGELSVERTKKIKALFATYHRVRTRSLGFYKGAYLYLIRFRNGQQIKVKTNRWGTGFYDATNKEWYRSEEGGYW